MIERKVFFTLSEAVWILTKLIKNENLKINYERKRINETNRFGKKLCNEEKLTFFCVKGAHPRIHPSKTVVF